MPVADERHAVDLDGRHPARGTVRRPHGHPTELAVGHVVVVELRHRLVDDRQTQLTREPHDVAVGGELALHLAAADGEAVL